jgi:hypothetical protein
MKTGSAVEVQKPRRGPRCHLCAGLICDAVRSVATSMHSLNNK